MYSYLSDHLFVGLAKRAGYPSKAQLRPVQEAQRRLRDREGFSISLFSLAQWEGLLTQTQADELMALARDLAARFPAYADHVIESPGVGLGDPSASAERAAPPPLVLDDLEPLAGLEEPGPADPVDPAPEVEVLDELEILDPGPSDEVWALRRAAIGDSGVVGALPTAGPVEVTPTWHPDDAVDPLEVALSATSTRFAHEDPGDDPADLERQARRRRRDRRSSRRRGRLESSGAF